MFDVQRLINSNENSIHFDLLGSVTFNRSCTLCGALLGFLSIASKHTDKNQATQQIFREFEVAYEIAE